MESVDNVMKRYKGLTCCSSQVRHPRGEGGRVLSYISHISMCRAQRVGFWSENGYRLCSFWSGIGFVFQGNNGSVRMYLLFQFQMSKKEREICKFEMDFKKCFLLLF